VNLEQQERLFKNQIRLGLREILQQELNFYSNAFNNISACASILAGFAFTGIMLDPYDHKSDNQPKWLQTMEWDPSRAIEAVFNTSAAATTCICLLTLVYSNYLGLFSTRLALRGGEMAVEDAVMKVRGEYKIVLYALTACVEFFIFTLTVLAFYKMELLDCCMVGAICFPSGIAVIYLYKRARKLFYLDKDDRFAAAKKKKSRYPNHNNDASIKEDLLNETTMSGRHSDMTISDFGQGRLSEIVNEVDKRNGMHFDDSTHGYHHHQHHNQRHMNRKPTQSFPRSRHDSWDSNVRESLNETREQKVTLAEQEIAKRRTMNSLRGGWKFLKSSKRAQSEKNLF